MSSKKLPLISSSSSSYLQNQNYDVYFGRGKIGTKLPGNVKYKELLYENCEAYNTTESRYERDMIAEKIVTTMKKNFRAKFWVMKREASTRLDTKLVAASASTSTSSSTPTSSSSKNALAPLSAGAGDAINDTNDTSTISGAATTTYNKGEEQEQEEVTNPTKKSSSAAALEAAMDVIQNPQRQYYSSDDEKQDKSVQHENKSTVSVGNDCKETIVGTTTTRTKRIKRSQETDGGITNSSQEDKNHCKDDKRSEKHDNESTITNDNDGFKTRGTITPRSHDATMTTKEQSTTTTAGPQQGGEEITRSTPNTTDYYEHPPGMNEREWIELRPRSKILRKIKQGMRDLYHRMKKEAAGAGDTGNNY